MAKATLNPETGRIEVTFGKADMARLESNGYLAIPDPTPKQAGKCLLFQTLSQHQALHDKWNEYPQKSDRLGGLVTAVMTLTGGDLSGNNHRWGGPRARSSPHCDGYTVTLEVQRR